MRLTVFVLWLCDELGSAASPNVASAQNAIAENLFVKASRTFDVSDCDEVRDCNPILGRHSIVFLADLYLVREDSNSNVLFLSWPE
jgi:hypothetical protein